MFPLPSSIGYGFGPGLSSHNRLLEIGGIVNLGRVGLAMTNYSSSNRGNALQWRSCTGGCGTDFQLNEDTRGSGDEDLIWVQGTSIANLYWTGNCTAGCPIQFGPSNGTNGIKQFFFSDSSVDAQTHPPFGLVNGHIARMTFRTRKTWTTGERSHSRRVRAPTASPIPGLRRHSVFATTRIRPGQQSRVLLRHQQ